MKDAMVTELKELFGEIEGAVVLHWEGDESEATHYFNLDQALSDVADAAIERNMTAEQIEALAYIVTEAEFEAQEEEYKNS